MDKKDKYEVKLSDQDMYWLQNLLSKFIEGDANMNQIEDCFTLYKKLKDIKNFDK